MAKGEPLQRWLPTTLTPTFEVRPQTSAPLLPSMTRANLPIPRDHTVTVTLNQSLLLVPTHFASVTTTRTETEPPLLNQAECTRVSIAVISDAAANPIVYPQIGCSSWIENCCPYGFGEGVLLNHCPGDYTTQVLGSYRACCPKLGNFTLFNSAIGHQTPCVSSLTGTFYVPATPLTAPNARIIDDIVLSYSFPLAHHSRRSVKPLAIVLPTVLGVALLLILIFAVHRKRRAVQVEKTAAPEPTPPGEDLDTKLGAPTDTLQSPGPPKYDNIVELDAATDKKIQPLFFSRPPEVDSMHGRQELESPSPGALEHSLSPQTISLPSPSHIESLQGSKASQQL